MQFTPEQYKRIVDKVEEVWKLPRICPVCHNDPVRREETDKPLWRIGDKLLTVPTADGVPTKHPYVFVPVVCSDCGYTFFFEPDFLVLGLIHENKPKEPVVKGFWQRLLSRITKR